MNHILSLVVFVSLLQFSSAAIAGILRVICYDDEESTVSKHMFKEDGSGGVLVQERFQIVIDETQIKDGVITISDKENWSRIVGDKSKLLRFPGASIALNQIMGKEAAGRLITSVSDMALATGSTMIYQKGDESTPESVKYFDVEEVIKCVHSMMGTYSVELRIVDPAPSPDKLKLELLQDPVVNGINAIDALAVRDQFGQEVDGYPVTFMDMHGTILKHKWNKKMYFVRIPSLPNTFNDMNKGIMKDKFPEPLLFRLGVGGADKVIGQQGDGKPALKVKHIFTGAGQAGFLVAGIYA